MGIREDFLKNFETSESFRKYCFGLSKTRINNMTTNDWISLHYGMNYLYKKLGCDKKRFIDEHLDVLEYLYSNYRQPKEISRHIKDLAYKVADSLSTSEEFAQLYYKIDIMSYTGNNNERKMAKILRRTVYDRVFKKNKLIAMFLMPRLEVVKRNCMSHNGRFCSHSDLALPKIYLRSGGIDFCNTAAHEIFHSLQNLRQTNRIKFFNKIGIDYISDEKMDELYRLNNFYYLKGNNNEDRPYKKQPLEYGARFFATCFERRLRKNIKAADNNWSLIHQTTQMLRYINVVDNNIQYTPYSVLIHVHAPSKKEESIINELSSRYLKEAQVMRYDDTTVLLNIPRNINNSIKINMLHTQAKADNVSKLTFVEHYFPYTYRKFYENAYQNPLSKAIINKLKDNKSKN